MSFYADQEQAHIVDTSSRVLDWALREHDYGLVDVAVPSLECADHGLADPSECEPSGAAFQQLRNVSQRAAALVNAVFDHYVNHLISAETQLILLGHGAGAAALVQLLANRETSRFRDGVAAVVNVLNHNAVPLMPAGLSRKTLRQWYMRKSLVLLPSDHVIYTASEREGRRMGNLERCKQKRSIDILCHEFSRITDFISAKLREQQR